MRPLLAAASVATLLAALAATPATARVTQPSGEGCTGVSYIDAQTQTLTMPVWAGPVRFVDEDDPTVVHIGRLTCSLRAGTVNHSGGTETASVSGPETAGAAVLAPTVMTVPFDVFGDNAFCTRLDLDGGAQTLYLNEPWDRNETPTWTTDPNARCNDMVEVTDWRITEDPPGRQAFQVAVAALGEADTALQLAGVQPDAPSYLSSLSVVRAAGRAFLRTAPGGWTCTDDATGDVVRPGSSLSTPPAVTCTTVGLHCDRVEVSGVLAPTTLGRVVVTSSCSGRPVSRQLAVAQGEVVAPWSTVYRDVGDPPLHCAVTEDTAAEPTYEAVCGVYTY